MAALLTLDEFGLLATEEPPKSIADIFEDDDLGILTGEIVNYTFDTETNLLRIQ